MKAPGITFWMNTLFDSIGIERLNMNYYLLKVMYTLLFLSVILFADESKFFRNDDDFRNSLIKMDIVPSVERIAIDTLFSLNNKIQIIVPRDIEISTITNTWPVLIYWKNNKGIVTNKISETAPTTRVAWGGTNVDTISRIFEGYKKGKIYAIELKDSLIQITDEMHGETSCIENVGLYIILLREDQKKIEPLTPKAIPLVVHEECKDGKESLNWKYDDDTLDIKCASAKEEQKPWKGKYIIRTDKLVRAQSFDQYVKEITAAHNAALKFYRKKQVQKAIEMLSPYILYGPKGALNKKTIAIFNDYGFFLAKNQEYEASLEMLYDVVSKFPERKVAHLNIGDVYYALGKKKKAREHYKIYSALMNADDNEKKIPSRVIERLK
ncbi:MAG: tetratricopeptide repeat protein [Chitinispirillaceae bacterium]